MTKLIIFDLDDTLISEFDFIQSGYRAIAAYCQKQYGIDENKAYNRLLELYKEGVKNNFNKLLEDEGILYDKEVIQKLIVLYRTHPCDIQFFDDVYPFLNKARMQGIKLGIITDGPVEMQKNKLDAIKARQYFDEIILNDERGMAYRKPNPSSYELMMRKFGVLPEETMVIADNPSKDFYLKKFYPCKMIRIIRDNAIYKNEEYKERFKEDITIQSLEEIIL